MTTTGNENTNPAFNILEFLLTDSPSIDLDIDKCTLEIFDATAALFIR